MSELFLGAPNFTILLFMLNRYMHCFTVDLRLANTFSEVVSSFNIGLIAPNGGKWSGKSWDAFNDYMSWFGEESYMLFLSLAAISYLKIGTHLSEIEMFPALFPVRYVIWFFVLGYCYKIFQRKSLLVFASLLGTLISYLLDLIVWALFGILPGMQMEFC